MASHVETELKLKLINAEHWQKIMEWPALAEMADPSSWRHDNLEAQYFDTEDYDLREARLAYRIRRENGEWVAAVKGGGSSDGGLHRRAEWEASVTEPVPSLTLFLDTPVGAQLAEAAGTKPLLPMFTTRFERYTVRLRPAEDTLIELALDRGAIIAGERQEPIQEIELELKEGRLSALLALAADLAGEFPLLFEERSKYARGLALAGLTGNNKLQAPAAIAADQPAADGARLLIVRVVHAVIQAEAGFFNNPEKPEMLHQVRVKVRRLRTLFSFFKPLMDTQAYQNYQAALGNWLQMLGPTRETDVVLAAWQELLASGAMAFAGHCWLGEVLGEQRREQVQAVYNQSAGGRATPIILSLWAWLEEGAFQDGTETSLSSFCVSRLAEWYACLYEFGKKPDLEDMDNLHRLRIAGKKIRYVLEALENGLPVSASDLTDRLKQLQDSLGYLRDAQMTEKVLQQLLADKSSRALFKEAGLLIGWQARGAYEHRRKAAKTWKRVRRRLIKHMKKRA